MVQAIQAKDVTLRDLSINFGLQLTHNQHIEAGLAQILSYMLANPNGEQPSFGMITTGGSFIFLKLIKGDFPQYGLSRLFSMLNPGNDLYTVLSILKGLVQTA